MKLLQISSAIFIVIGLVFTTSCSEDFIDLHPLDQANTGNSFENANDANLALMGVYDALQSQGYAQDMAFLVELITDNAATQASRIGVAGARSEREMATFRLTDGNIHMYGRWSALYGGIARANQLLDRIGDIPFKDGTLKEQYMGEAKFLRAQFYFDLVRFFGGVPVTLQEIQSPQEAFALGRETEASVYDVIIQDLLSSIDLLPEEPYSNSDIGRVTTEAAQALLAKVYLTMGNAGAAEDLLQDLNGSYGLVGSYAELFDQDNSSESIFEIQYTSTAPDEGNAYPNFFLPRDGNAGKDVFGEGFLGGTANGSILPSDDLWDSYEPGDERRDYTIAKYYSGQEGDTIYRVNKYRGEPTSANNSEDNIILLRYADVMLMLAEAINENNNGPTGQAYDLVDELRLRAGLTVLTRDKDYNEFKTALLEERRHEFAFENHRWFDLKRFGMALSILSAKGYPIQSHNLLFPIPLQEVEISDNLKQNPGY